MNIIRHFRILVLLIVGAASSVAVLATRSSAAPDYLSERGMPYDAFDRLPQTDIDVGGAVIHVAFAPGDIALGKDEIFSWVKTSAKAVSTYYGRFPAKSLKLLFVPVSGGRVQGGTTWGYRGAAIRIRLGDRADADDLKRDWVLVHEMVHLALPDVEERYSWLSEGLAVYIEPIARTQAGDLSAGQIWTDMMRDMPKGMPALGDRGLDNTDTWGRKYWGGAMFCLLADIQIRQQTDNRYGLQDAMRGVLAAGGNHEVDWSIDRIFAVADKAVGVDVLERLHRDMGPKPYAPDMSHVWSELGLRMDNNRVALDDGAPLAGIRAAITKTPAQRG